VRTLVQKTWFVTNTTIRIWLAWIVVAIWSAAAIVAFFTQNFEELGIITPVMMIVVGFVFGYKSSYTPPGGRED
jgi:hypothetical protein